MQLVPRSRHRYGILRDARSSIGFIGTFGQWHGVEFLAECIRDMIRDELGWIEQKKVHFMLVGDGLKMPVVRRALALVPLPRIAICDTDRIGGPAGSC